MADFSRQKLNIVSDLKNATTALLQAINAVKILQQEASDAGFAAGGANVLADADLATAYPSLVASDVAAALTAFSAIDTALAATSRTGYKALTRIKEA